MRFLSTGHFKNGVRGPESRQKPGERCDFCLPPGRNSARVVSKVDKKWGKGVIFESSPNLCVNYFFSRALVVQGMPLHPCLCTSTLEGAVKGAPLRTSKRFP